MSRSVSYASGSVWVQYLRPSRVGEDDQTFGEMEEDWDDFVEGLQELLKGEFPSLHNCDHWCGREDHAILENKLVYIGISEYCGLVSVWCVDKERQLLGRHWAEVNRERAKNAMLRAYPGQCLVSKGTFSNGEQAFELVGEPGSCVTSKEGRLW